MLFAGLSWIYVFTRTTLNKKIVDTYKMNPWDLNSICQLILGTVFTFIVLSKYNFSDVDSWLMIYWGTSGVVHWIASLAVYHAIITGYVGPAVALSGLSPLIQTILTAIQYGPIPSKFQVLAMILGMLGCIIITLGPTIAKWLKTENKLHN